MAGFLYFLPCDVDKINKDNTQALADEKGIGYAFEDPPTLIGCHGKGPGGVAGAVLTDSKQPRPGYYPDAQTWKQMPEKQVWLGHDNDGKPGPEDLARIKQVRGYKMEMPDGKLWHVPVARAIEGTCALPSTAQWNGKMWSRGNVLPQYQELFSDACRVMDVVIDSGGGSELNFDGEASITVRALAINYRVGPCEVDMLKLITEESIVGVLRMLIDWPALEDMKKKMEAGTLSSPPGDTD